MIYLDNASTTQTSDVVLSSMIPYLTEQYANPGTLYNFGRTANEAVQYARVSVSRLFGCEPNQIIFTASGSEANNMVFQGVAEYLKKIGKTHILVSSVEHNSTIKAASSLKNKGFDVEFIPVTEVGIIDVTQLENMIREDTGLISVMYVNNETGAVNPIEEIGTICLKKNILFHTDCVQAAGTHKIDVTHIGCDFASVSGHKIHAVKGIGALYVKNKVKLNPLVYGGSQQEFGLRGGTENVPGIVALGKACEICCESIHEDMITVSSLKQHFFMELTKQLQECGLDKVLHINGMPVIVPGKILNIRFDGVDGETLLLMLDVKGVCVSAGSACQSKEVAPSHVLTSMGLSSEQARSSIRVSFSKTNTISEAEEAANILAKCVATLAKI